VKKYRRSAAGKDPEIFPEDIRPPEVLKKTMDYLVYNILQRSDQEFLEIYNFVRDRGRALRKDFKIQSHLHGNECVDVLERLTRFLILSDLALCELPESRFSWKQNRHQIIDTLTTLLDVYKDEEQNGVFYPNEPEFRSYFILLMIDDTISIDRFQSWRHQVRQDPQVQHAILIHQTFQAKLYSYFLCLLRQTKTTYLMACILNICLAQVRKDNLFAYYISTPAKDKPLCMDTLRYILFMEGYDETIIFKYCLGFGLDVSENEIGEKLIRLSNKETKTWTGKQFLIFVI
jgi:SAC3/GANP family